ncbi:unnamed protein product [Alopecurus aequalis]
MMGVLDNFRSSAWIYLTPVAAACAPIGVLRTYFNQHLRRPVRRLLPFLDPFVTIDIPAKPEDYSYSYYNSKAKSSDAYAEVLAYLSEVCSREARELRAEGADEGHGFVLSLREGQEVADEFKGVTMWWSAVAEDKSSYRRSSGRCCRLTFHERHRRLVVDEYLPYVRRTGQEVTVSNRPRRLYTNKKQRDYSSDREEVWSYIDFDHPTTFDTLAMDPAQKQNIMDDLEDFRNNKDYYRRIGRAWKRGYLLFGPPGTGKSTMIAAMANYLNYDVYDIELTTLHTNYDLRKLFIETKSKSIIVIEDIDCSLDLSGNRATTLPTTQDDDVDDVTSDRKRRKGTMLTLSGLLNFIDGLWSAHSGERIIVFTTNHLDKLDPALIRRGRMDKHIEMSYCRFEAFRTLAKNYLGAAEHPLFDTIKELLQMVDMTPADVAECMMMSERGARDKDACLGGLVRELNKKLEEKEDQKKVEGHEAKMETDGSKEKLPSENGKKDNADEDAAEKPNGTEVMANGVNCGQTSSGS